MRRSLVCSLALSAGLSMVLAIDLNPAHAQTSPAALQARQTLEFYGSRAALRTLSEMPQRLPIQPAQTGPLQHNGKPFQGVSNGPTVSPYLYLFNNNGTSNDAVPAYYTYVRPQLEQQAAFQQQQRENQQLSRQQQSGTQYRASTMPSAGRQARYFDTAQFYGGWQR